jgi:hypothetical protein
MINNLRIKAKPIKGLPLDQQMKKIEEGKMVTGLLLGNRHQLTLSMETDMETIKKIAGFIAELEGKKE